MAALGTRRFVFNPVQKRWSHENPRQRLLDTCFEIRTFAALLIEIH